jgi:hypothetical protein
MTREHDYYTTLDPRGQQAVTELTELIRQCYPSASFAVGPGEDDAAITHILATVDVDDPDEVTDLTIERELQLQIDEGVPVYVIPIRMPERVAKLVAEQRKGQQTTPVFPLPLLRPVKDKGRSARRTPAHLARRRWYDSCPLMPVHMIRVHQP